MDLEVKKYAERIAPTVKTTNVPFYIHRLGNGKLSHGFLNSFQGKKPDYQVEVADNKLIVYEDGKQAYSKKLKSIQKLPDAPGVEVPQNTEDGETGVPDSE